MQSTQALRSLAIALALGGGLAAPALRGQTRFRIAADSEWFYQAANGRRLAQVLRGAMVSGGAASGDWTPVTLDGWVFAPSLGPSPKPDFAIAIAAPAGENLRLVPNGPVVARLVHGFGLNKVATLGRWVHVQRDGWMHTAALAVTADVASTVSAAPDSDSTHTPAPIPPSPVPDSAVDSSEARSTQRTMLYRAPDGPPAGTLAGDAPVRVLSRSGEWTRVEVQGWVKSSDLATNPAGVLLGVSAAELRADPARYQGQVLKWTLQFISLQTADASDGLRPEIPNGLPYALARGPLPEKGFVYVVVPAAQLTAVQALAPLSNIEVTARVRVGRSRWLGNPVVDLISFQAVQ